MSNDVYHDAFLWVMLGRPMTAESIADALPILRGMGFDGTDRPDVLVLPNGTRIDVLPIACDNPPYVTLRG